MYFITGGIGFLGCLIFMVLVIIFALRGKSCTVPLIAMFLSVFLFLGSGFLYTRTDPNIGGGDFLKFVVRDRTVPPDLAGEWREQNGSDDSFHGILISGDTIEIYWVSEGGNAASLYWAGSYVPPPDGKEPYTWVSENDVTRTSAAQLASGESSKTFTYQNGILSYSASVLGVTTTIEAKKQPWQPVEDENGNLVTPPADNGEKEVLPPSAGDLEDYHAVIKQAALASDSEGNPAIVITYAWTNNSEEATSPMMKMLEKAFQNGEQLNAAVMGEDSGYNIEARTQDVPPGTTVDVPCAFTLVNEKAPVEFELSALLSLSGSTLAKTFDPAELS